MFTVAGGRGVCLGRSSVLLASRRSDRRQSNNPFGAASTNTPTPGPQYSDAGYFSSGNGQQTVKDDEFMGMPRAPKRKGGGVSMSPDSKDFVGTKEFMMSDDVRSEMKETTDNVKRMTATRSNDVGGSLAMRTCLPRQKLILSQHIPQHLKSKLPMNLILFDGQCPFCVEKTQEILFRNFTYSAFDESENDSALRDKRFYFASLHKEGRELRRLAQSQLGVPYSPSAPTLDSVVRGGLGVTPEVLADTDATMFIFLERIPSKLADSAAKRNSASGGFQDCNVNTRGGSGVDPAFDLLVSSQGYAAARIMMKLDRFSNRVAGLFLNHIVPTGWHSLAFQKFHQRRHFNYLPIKGIAAEGDRDVTVGANSAVVQGLQSRLWTMRNGAGSGSLSNDQYKLFDTTAEWEQIAKNRKR